MTADKGTTDLRGALARAVEGGYADDSIDPNLYHNDAVYHAIVWEVRKHRAALASTESAKGTTDLRAALDVPTVERVLRRYFQAVDATGRSRSWWRVRAEEVAAALASTESDRPALPTGLDLDAERRYLIDALTFRDGDRPHTVEEAAYRLDRYALNAAACDYLPVPVPPARSPEAGRRRCRAIWNGCTCARQPHDNDRHVWMNSLDGWAAIDPALYPDARPALDVEALAFAMCTALHPHWTKAKTDTEGHRLGHGEDARVIAAEYAAILAAEKETSRD